MTHPSHTVSKVATEILLKMWTKRYGLETATRLFQVYAENPRQDGVISIFLRASEGRPITLTETAPKIQTARRDFIHLEDVARAFLAAAECKTYKRKALHLILPRAYPRNIVVAEIIGGEVQYIPRRNYEVECHQADLTKTRRVLNWEAKIEFVSWLKEFVNNESRSKVNSILESIL